VTRRARPEEDKVAVLSGRLAVLNQKLDQIRARAAEDPDVTVFLDLLTDLDRQRRDTIEQLENAKAEAVCREADNLGEAQLLIALLDGTPPEARDDLRRKIRARFRQLVKYVWVLIAANGRKRLIATQVSFHEGARRDYIILLQPGAEPQVKSFRDLIGVGDYDPRRPEHAEQFTKLLSALP